MARCRAEINAILNDEEASETLECPAQVVGRIIGRGGETIRALQAASQVRRVALHCAAAGCRGFGCCLLLLLSCGGFVRFLWCVGAAGACGTRVGVDTSLCFLPQCVDCPELVGPSLGFEPGRCPS